MKRGSSVHLVPIVGCVAAIGSCGFTIGMLLAGARMPAWEQFLWPLINLVVLLAYWMLNRTCRGLLDLAATQNELIAGQGKQLDAASRLLRDPSWPLR